MVAAAWPRVEELTFDAERRRMATIHTAGGEVWVAVKGALEAIGPLLDATEADLLRRAERVAERYAADGYRVLALAERTIDDVPARLDDAEHGLHLLGVVGMADPPRAASAPSIAACRAAGITPIMITGDHPLTANAIARRIGILREGGRSLTGAELEQLDDAAFDAIVADVAVYARTNPEQKLRIVDAWRRRGAVVSMTGDGVNDAPALQAGRHRRRDGRHRDRGQQGGGRHGPGRRRLRDDRRRRRGGPADLRQHPALRPLPVDHELRRDLGDDARPVPGTSVSTARRPDPVGQPRHRRAPGPCPGRRADGARHDAPAAALAVANRSSPAASGSTRSGSGC